MKKKIIIGVSIGIVVVVIIGVSVFFLLNDKGESRLRQEAEKIAKMDLLSEDVDMNIKTKDEYGVIEQSIKEYINDYSKNLKEMQNLLNEEKMQKILSIDNYKNDGPEFSDSTNYIKEAKTKFDEIMNKLISLTSEEEMMKSIQNKNLGSDFLNLYKELMLGNQLSSELNDTVATLKETSNQVKKIFDVQEKILTLLRENKDSWTVNEENIIEFTNEDIGNKYNEYINELSESENTNSTQTEENE